jgi:hypothetical protein
VAKTGGVWHGGGHRQAMTRFLCDIDFASEPINGTLREQDGTEHPFVGWLGLSEVFGRIAERQGVFHEPPSGDSSGDSDPVGNPVVAKGEHATSRQWSPRDPS